MVLRNSKNYRKFIILYSDCGYFGEMKTFVLPFLCLSVCFVPVAKADLLISIFENTEDGSAILELDGSIVTNAVQGTVKRNEGRLADLSSFGDNEIYIFQYPDLVDAFHSYRELSASSGDFSTFSLNNDFDTVPDFNPALEFTGAEGFTLSIQDVGIARIDVYGQEALGPISFYRQRILFSDFNFSTAIPGKIAEWGAYGGEAGDGIRVEVLSGEPVYPVVMTEEDLRPDSRPDLWIGASFRRQKGDDKYERKRASRRQTVRRYGEIGTEHTAAVHLTIENDGREQDEIAFRARVKKKRGVEVTVHAYNEAKRSNVTAKVRRGAFQANLNPGETQAIAYRMKTQRFFAGLHPDRGNEVEFTIRSKGGKDHGAMRIQFR